MARRKTSVPFHKWKVLPSQRNIRRITFATWGEVHTVNGPVLSRLHTLRHILKIIDLKRANV